MVSPVRVGLTRGGRPTVGAGAQTYPGTTSGYGATHGESVGYNPANPQAYSASQAAKAYGSSRNTVLSPSLNKGAAKDNSND